jgi:hypothetical protein
LKQDNRLGVFEKRMLRKIFRLERVEVTGEWRRLHNEEFLIFNPYQILFE